MKGLAWSPDSTKLAVAQTDNIVFVYKLSSSPEKAMEWGEKKSICNKFIQTSPVTCMSWPIQQPNILVFGCLDGKVRVGNLKTNKSQGLYTASSTAISCVTSPDGSAIATGHADGTIMRFYFEDADSTGGNAATILVKHSTAPYALAWGEHILAAGCDKRIVIYDEQGRVVQHFGETADKNEREYTVAATSPSGQTLVVGSYNKIRVFNFNIRRSNWEEAPAKIIENFYTVTALAWKPDGSRLAVGSLCGAAELFDCCLRRTRYKGKFEFTYVGPSQVIVKKLSTGARLVLKSNYNYEVLKVNILGNDQYLVAHTTDTLLIGDLASCRLSEILWRGSGSEKFFFENPAVCMIFNAGELVVVEYGANEILGSVRTEHMNPHLLSVRMNDRVRRGDGDNKKIAFLMDAKTIAVLDFVTGTHVAVVNHDAKIDWMELNETGHKILFRDKRRRLQLFNIDTQTKSSLLSYSTYVQWVPNSDVVIAQSHQNLCIWYNIDAPERVTTFPLKGEITDIERANGRTDIIVEDGVNQVAYTLDEGLIEFGTAMEDGDLLRAVAFLETLESTPESDAMWSTLAKKALQEQNLIVAARSYAALGDIAKAQYLQKAIDAARVAEENLHQNGNECYEVRARLALLNGEFKHAETIYLEQGRAGEAIKMYQSLHRWGEALDVARMAGEDVEALQETYTRQLTQTGQDEEAAILKEKQGDLLAAVNLFLKAGMAARAATIIMHDSSLLGNREITERVGAVLMKAALYSVAGELFEKIGTYDRALEAYRKGNVFRKAVDLCRTQFPTQVVPLEEAWGDYLVGQKQLDGAINHYIEAGCNVKAIEAAIQARQWSKAAQIVELQEEAIGRQYYKLIASHYAEVRQYSIAQKYFLAARAPREAIDMYIKAGMFSEAHELCAKYMQPDEVADLYVQQAEVLEQRGKFKEAEKLYVTVNEPDLAINMYKRLKQYNEMIRLVEKHHPDLLPQTHQHLGQLLERDNHFSQAEQHYIAARDYKAAIRMYANQKQWEDAFRVAKANGDATDTKQVAYEWVVELGVPSGIKLLTKLNLLDAVIDVGCERTNFDFTLELARTAAKHKLSDVYSKHGMYLEDQMMFKEAEEKFLKAQKPREAVLMYVHQQDWDSAQRVAETYDPDSVSDVLVGQARVAFEQKDYQKAEGFLLRGQRAELAVRYYKECGMWNDALRLVKEYLPNKMEEVMDEYREWQRKTGSMGIETLLQNANESEVQGDHWHAIESYMQLSPQHSDNIDLLEEAWEKAAELAMKFVPDRARAVVAAVCDRLTSVNRPEPAIDLFLGVDMIQEAIELCMQIGNWNKARTLAKEHSAEVSQFVEQKYVMSLKQGGTRENAAALVTVDPSSGLDMYVERGEWDECLKQAAKQGAPVLNKYTALYAATLIRQGRAEQALGLFVKYGAPVVPQNFNLYKHIASDLFSTPSGLSYSVYAQLRDLLLTVAEGTKQANDLASQRDFEKLLIIAHYMATRAAASSQSALLECATKLSIALLRHTDIVPADKAFYEAGQLCIKNGWESMAFVFLNRFLEVTEAITEGSLNLDNTDFVGTDIPFEIPLPKEPSIPEGRMEATREWVITYSMDRKSVQVLDRDERGVFVGTLKDARSGKVYDACVLTGFPILRNNVSFKPGYAAIKEDWNKYLMAMKSAADDNLKDVLRFLNRWCGAPLNPTYSFQ